MATARSFPYDHTNYTLVRQQDMGKADVASATDFAIFRSRAKVIVTAINLVVVSAASLAAVLITALRGASVAATYTLTSATSAGLVTAINCGLTIHSIGELFSLRHNDIGDYHIVYEYQVIPEETLYTRA